MTAATPQVVIAPVKRRPVMKLVSRGRRALGEDWNETTIYQDESTGAYELDVQPTEAPADQKAIIVPSGGVMEAEMMDYIIGKQKKEAEYRAAHPQRPRYESMAAEINAMWQDYVSEKLAWLQRRSQIGPGGFQQRGDM